MKQIIAALAFLILAAASHAQVPEVALRDPAVSIGSADGDSANVLFGAFQALRTSDGRIVALNSGSQQVRVYDAAGRLVRSVGRRGAGPGEFRMLQRIGLLAGDSIAAYDIGLGRITVFTPGGAIARTVQVQPFGNAVLPRAYGFTSTGMMLVSTDFDRVFRPGTRRDSLDFALVSTASGAPTDTVGRYAGEEAFVLVHDGGASRRGVIFGRNVFASARGERLVIGQNDTFRYDVFYGGGRSRRTFEHPHTPRSVTRADVAAANRDWLEGMPAQFRDAVAARIAEFPHSAAHPPFTALLAGADGTVVVEHAAPPGAREHRWTTFAPNGAARRVLVSAQPLTLLDAGEGWVLARSIDALGVERLLLFRYD